jgi:hypothetical protein
MTVSSIILHCKICRKFVCSLDTNSQSLVSSDQIATMLVGFMKDQNITVVCESCQPCCHDFTEHEHEHGLEDLR